MSEVIIQRAEEILDKLWRPDRGLPTSPSHPDTFMTNLDGYVEAHLSMGNLDRALTEFELWKQSRYPSGFTPHYMLGSHKRAGIETKWIDARVQRTIKLDNGERVTPLAGPPNWALAALSITKYIESTGQSEKAKQFVDDNFDLLVESSQALYDSRINDGFIAQFHPDELTIRDGLISSISRGSPHFEAGRTKWCNTDNPQDKKRLIKNLNPKLWTVEDGINGMLLENNFALAILAVKYDKNIPRQLAQDMDETFDNVLPELLNVSQYSHDPDSIVKILGTVRATRAISDGSKIIEIIGLMNDLIATTRDRLGPYEYSSAKNQVVRPDINLRIARLAILATKDKRTSPRVSNFHAIGSNILRVLENSAVFSRIIDPQSTNPVIGSNVVAKRIKGSQELWMPTVTEALLYAKSIR